MSEWEALLHLAVESSSTKVFRALYRVAKYPALKLYYVKCSVDIRSSKYSISRLDP